MYRVRLAAMRKDYGWTLEEVATKLGVSTSALNGWEKGYRKPNVEVMKQLAGLYNTSADYILGLTDERIPKPITMNAKELLMQQGLHWDGEPLTDEELATLRTLLDYMLKEKREKLFDEKSGS